MSKININRSVKTQFNAFRSFLKQNKKLLTVGLCFIGVGILFSLIGIKDYSDNHEIVPIFALIYSGGFSFVKFDLLLPILLCAPVIVLFILSINYFLFLLSFPLLTLISFWFFRYAFASFTNGFIAASLSFLFVILPIFCVFFLGITSFVGKTIALIGYRPCNKILYFTPYRTYFTSLKKYFIRYFLCCVVVCFIYANVVLLTVYLISGA